MTVTAKKTRKPKAKVNVSEKIADKILKSLESGVRPWEQCYSVTMSGFPKQHNGTPYNGINRILLLIAMWEKGYTNPVWMTYNQAKKLGGQVRKGEAHSMSVFYGTREKKELNPDTGKPETYSFAKYNVVFNAEQIDGLSEEYLAQHLAPVTTYDTSPVERAEAYIKNIPAEVVTKDRVPCFSPAEDKVFMPEIKQFKTTEQYYATFIHELAHWSGAKTRLDRKYVGNEWSKENYAREELVAEITAAFVCPTLGLKSIIDTEHAPYLNMFIKVLKTDPKAFMKASAEAQKAMDYLNSFQPAKAS